MDSHHIGRGVIEAEEKLGAVQSKCMVIGISSDILYPTNEQQFIAAHVPDAQLKIIESAYGHDGFLLENEKLTAVLKEFIHPNK